MAEKTPIDGFYAAYFTGSAGNSIGIFVSRDGIVAGADAGGGRYDGTYRISDDRRKVLTDIRFNLPVGNYSITGLTADAQPITVDIHLELPIEFNRNDIHRLETPIGPINAKFDKIRGA